MLKLLSVNFFLLTVLILLTISTGGMRRMNACAESSSSSTLEIENPLSESTHYPQVFTFILKGFQLPMGFLLSSLSDFESIELFLIIPQLLSTHRIALPPPLIYM